MDTTGRTDAGGAAIRRALMGRAVAERKKAIAGDLFAHADGVEELADGYGWRFSAAELWATRALEFVLSERRRCPFFAFEPALEPHVGAVWLRMRGGPAAKPFVLEELEAILPPALRPNGARGPVAEAILTRRWPPGNDGGCPIDADTTGELPGMMGGANVIRPPAAAARACIPGRRERNPSGVEHEPCPHQ